MFATLMSKTFLLLGFSLVLAYLGAIIAQQFAQKAIQLGAPQKLKGIFLGAIIVNIIAFLALMFLRANINLSLVLLAAFTLSSGFTLGFITFKKGDVAVKAAGVTALTVFLTALIAMYSGLDFSWLGKFLFFALLGLIGVSIVTLFVRIKEATQKFFAAFGVLIFTGYLLFDFNQLSKAKTMLPNTWETALTFAVSIYLDIVNLFLQLMNLMSSSN